MRSTGVAWEFAGRRLRLLARNEASKWDVNVADIDDLERVLLGVLGEEDARRAAQAVRSARRERREFAHPENILPLLDRFGESAAALRASFTVFTGQAHPYRPPSREGFGGPAPTDLGRPDTGAGTYRSIYTLHVTSTDEGPPIRRETVLILDVPGAPFRILDSR